MSQKFEMSVYDKYNQVPKKYSDNEKYPSIPLYCEEGDVFFFDLDLLHRSGINTSNMIRWSAQARYHNATETSFLSKYDLEK
jgi:ectoine hydroxylase-related dioxygenase (phytanoyl-CoA dioxygenase family)